MKKYFYLLLMGLTITSIPALAIIKREVIPTGGVFVTPGYWYEATIQDVDDLVKSGEIKLMKNKNTIDDDYDDTVLEEAVKYDAPLQVIQYLVDLGESAEEIELTDIYDYTNFDKEEEEKFVSDRNKLIVSKCPEFVIHADPARRMSIFNIKLSKLECLEEDVVENFNRDIDNYLKSKRLKLVEILKTAGMKLDEAFLKTIERMNENQHDLEFLKDEKMYH